MSNQSKGSGCRNKKEVVQSKETNKSSRQSISTANQCEFEEDFHDNVGELSK